MCSELKRMRDGWLSRRDARWAQFNHEAMYKPTASTAPGCDFIKFPASSIASLAIASAWDTPLPPALLALPPPADAPAPSRGRTYGTIAVDELVLVVVVEAVPPAEEPQRERGTRE